MKITDKIHGLSFKQDIYTYDQVIKFLKDNSIEYTKIYEDECFGHKWWEVDLKKKDKHE